MITAEITSEVTGFVTGFGLVSPDEVLVMDELEMRRAGNRFGKKFGEVPLPTGASLTIVVTDD
jgi:hypothetical protein